MLSVSWKNVCFFLSQINILDLVSAEYSRQGSSTQIWVTGVKVEPIG